MEYFTQLNAKLDQGWKLSTSSCESCNKSLLYSKDKHILHCLGCKKDFEVEMEEQEHDPEQREQQNKEQEYQDYEKIKEKEMEEEMNREIFERERLEIERQLQQKPDHSQAMSKKLLQGWTMLEECCPDCYIPIMRKGKESTCVGCDNAYKNKKIEQLKENTVQQAQPQPPVQVKQQTNQQNQVMPQPQPCQVPQYSQPSAHFVTLPSGKSVPQEIYQSIIQATKNQIEVLNGMISKEQRHQQIKENIELLQRLIEVIHSL